MPIMSDHYVRDKLGWIDDFRALPGECGQPLTQKIYAYALMQQGVSLSQLKEMGFSSDVVLEIFNMRMAEVFGENR